MAKAEEERYGKLGYKEAFARRYQYPMACKELSFVLRQAYAKLPKTLQSIIFQDTLLAFRLLPQMQTSNAASAAHLLLQSAEATFPKQRKSLAAKEFKHAMVAHKRRCKALSKDQCSMSLPQDVLIHIFSFLDLKSLVTVGQVCWSWNFAASDNHLWESIYGLFFEGSRNSESRITRGITDWREAFKQEYRGNSSKRLTSNRAYCTQCKAIVWLENMKCPNRDSGIQNENCQTLPVSSHQIVDYLLNGFSSNGKETWLEMLLESSSDSDDESDEHSLWASAIRFSSY